MKEVRKGNSRSPYSVKFDRSQVLREKKRVEKPWKEYVSNMGKLTWKRLCNCNGLSIGVRREEINSVI